MKWPDLAKNELAKIGIVDPAQVVDSVVIRIPKAYPAYFGSYDKFPELRQFLDQFDNLLLIGRNGMHRYNNMGPFYADCQVGCRLCQGKASNERFDMEC